MDSEAQRCVSRSLSRDYEYTRMYTRDRTLSVQNKLNSNWATNSAEVCLKHQAYLELWLLCTYLMFTSSTV